MYVDVVPNRNSPPAILLREGWREHGKIRKRTIANLSHWPPEKIERLRKVLKNEPLVHPQDAFNIESSLPHGHVELVLLAIHKLKLPQLLNRRPSPQRDRVIAMIAQRVLHPASKLATTRYFHTTTLAQQLNLENTVNEDDLYRAMDWLLERQPAIEARLAKRHLSEGAQVLYDVTSSYYEGHTCPLVRFGHSRDRKRGRPIVVYGVLADGHGRPVALQAYPGNTGDPTTVPDQVDKLRRSFGLKNIILIGDRGMLTETKIKYLKRHPGLGWISALRHSDIRELVQENAFQPSLFDQYDLAEIHSQRYPGERLVVCYNPLLAERRRHVREELLVATETALERIQREVERRTRKPLTGKQIAEKVGRVKNRFKVAKHFDTLIEDGKFHYARSESSIERESALDGFYIIRTDQPCERLSAADVVRSYKNLGRVERAFRCLKSVDLLIRPIRHRTTERVKAHLFLCMLAYYIEWHLREALAPLLFHEEQPDDRRNPVAPPELSKSVKRKKSKKITDDGLPVQSFSTLLAELSTVNQHKYRMKSDSDSPLLTMTKTTVLHSRAMELLGLFPVSDT